MIVLIIILIFFTTMLFVFVVPAMIKESEHKKRVLVTNQKIDEKLKKISFKLNKKYYLADNVTFKLDLPNKQFIAINTEDKKICIIDYIQENMYILDFKEILDYEIYEYSNNQSSGAVIGGMGLGVWGGETHGNCKKLMFIIKIDNYEVPQVVYNVISDTLFNLGVDKSSKNFQDSVASIKEIASFIDVIKNEK